MDTQSLEHAYIQLLEAELARTTAALQHHRSIHDVRVVGDGESHCALWYLRGRLAISCPRICRKPARKGDPRIHNSLLIQKWAGVVPDASVIVYISLWETDHIPPRIVSDEYTQDLFHVMSGEGRIYATMTRKNARCVIREIARLYADNLPVVDYV